MDNPRENALCLDCSDKVHCREHLNGYQLVRIIEFTDELPKTVSSKIRRVELRDAEAARVASGDVTGQFLYARYRNRG